MRFMKRERTEAAISRAISAEPEIATPRGRASRESKGAAARQSPAATSRSSYQLILLPI